MKKITEEQALQVIADYEQLLDRAEEVFCWLRDTDKRFRKEECRGHHLDSDSVSFAGNVWVYIHSSYSVPMSLVREEIEVMFPFRYLWMSNAEIAAERAEKDALREAAKIAEEKAIAALKQRAKEDRKREKEAKERKHLRELASKYPDEVGS